MNELLVQLPLATDYDSNDIGSKARSLDWLIKHEFRVPETFVLTTHFFDHWSKAIEDSREWRELVDNLSGVPTLDRKVIQDHCQQLGTFVANLAFTQTQLRCLAELAERVQDRLAVRSSGLDEDLAGASFAGMYDSFLNVRVPDLTMRIRDCFCAVVNERVLMYRLSMGFDFVVPKLAVIVQRQIESEVSGVSFSINPINNDYDEIVVNARKGLGDLLVSGQVTPDSWVIDKHSLNTIDFQQQPANGGAAERPCLDDEGAIVLAKTTKSLEQQMESPVDVEWTIDESGLHLLQVRPVTSWVQLPKEMLTEPSEPRLLYFDPGLADGVTISRALSRSTIEFYMYLLHAMTGIELETWYQQEDPKRSFIFSNGLRIYCNMSFLLDFINPKQLAEDRKVFDVALAQAYEKVDFSRYRMRARKLQILGPAFKFGFRVCRFMMPFFRAQFFTAFAPKRFMHEYQLSIERFEQLIERPNFQEPVGDFVLRYALAWGRTFLDATLPAVIALLYGGLRRLNKLESKLPEDLRPKVEAVRGGGENLVREMGSELAELAKQFPVGAFDDLDSVSESIAQSKIDPAIANAWQKFVERFGCRGPLEMELAVPKYGDDPSVLLTQLASIGSVQLTDPRAIYKERRTARDEALEELKLILDKRNRKRLLKAHGALRLFEQSRELPKHHLCQVTSLVRSRILLLAEKLHAAGRLDRVDDIFDLAITEMAEVERDPSIDVRQLIEDKCTFVRKASSTVKHFPHLIDSRGRIVRAPALDTANKDSMAGVSVSRGIATGPALVMDDPFQKILNPGDVLVAHTTDPGWTPLFINAAAIVLEIGGELQHGALVAREYGKPCVVGVVDATKRIQDGQQLEVDADTGIVRLISNVA